MARKAEVAALAARRFEAARRFARGESQAAAARALDVTPRTACRWSLQRPARAGQILQIVPAREGWQAIYRDDSEVITLPVVCWALVEYCDGTQTIVGWVASGDHLEAANDDMYVGFAEYRPSGGRSEGRSLIQG